VAEAAKAPGRATIYDAFRQPPDRSLRRLPRLVGTAFALVWRASPRQLGLLTTLQVLAGAGVAAQLLVGAQVVAAVLRAERLGLGLGSVVPSLLALLAVSALLGCANAARVELTRLLAEATARHAQDRIIAVATDVDLEAYERPQFHDRLQRAQVAAQGRPLNLVTGVTGLVGALVGVLGLVVALAALAPVLVPIVLAGYAPLWAASVRNSQAAHGFGWQMTPADRLRHYLASVLTSKANAQELRAFELGPYVRRRYDALLDERMARLRDLVRARLRRSLWASVAGSALTAATFAVLVALLLSGRLSPEAAVPAAVGVQQLGGRLQAIAHHASLIYENSLFLEDFDSFLELVPAVAAARPQGPAPAGFEVLELEDVSFTYPDASRPALVEVNLSVRRGEVVALVGENGSGKTTLAKLLCHLYLPTAGRVLWDGVDTAGCGPGGLRRQVAAVFQDFVRYHLTARENVSAGDCARADDLAAVVEAACAGGADEFIALLPDGYEAQLGREFEGGAELSVGQWQRVALSRAFFRDAPLLVLDEPTAALDARAEHELFEQARALAQGRTVVVISHRFSSVRTADRIVVLHQGRVVEQGSHGELMALGGRYAELFTLQARAYLDGGGTDGAGAAAAADGITRAHGPQPGAR
jgi:ATP-binding cassette, subfamily B, bacterial